MRYIVTAASLAISLWALAPQALGQYTGTILIPDQRIQPESMAVAHSFASDIAVDGDWAIVAHPFWNRGDGPTTALDNTGAHATVGAVHFFERTATGWVLRQTLSPLGIAGSSAVGTAVGISGTTAVFAAPTLRIDANTEGAVFVCELVGTTWRITQRLDALAATGSFGRALALDGDSLMVGNPFDDTIANDHGVVECFERVGGLWSRAQVLGAGVLPNTTANLRFGRTVELQGQSAVIGLNGVESGQLVVPDQVIAFEQVAGVWTQVAHIVNPLPGLASNNFGASIALDGDLLVVGAPQFASVFQAEPGFAAVYERNPAGDWQFEQVLRSSSPFSPAFAGSDGFGQDVSAKNGAILVGAPTSMYSPSDPFPSGQTFLFTQEFSGLWSEAFVLRSSQESTGFGNFGISVALGTHEAFSGDFGLLGPGGLAPREAYVFALPRGQVSCFGPTNSTGQAGGLRVTGDWNFTSGNLMARANSLPTGQAALLLASRQSGLTSFPSGSLGDLCLGGNIGRLGVAVADQQGRALLPFDPLAMPVNPTTSIAPGDTWYFQVWYRDQHMGSSSNFTHSVVVDF